MILKWRTVAPILSSYDDTFGAFTSPTDFGNGVQIAPTSLFPLPPNLAEGFSARQVFDFTVRKLVFVVDYEDGVGVDDSRRSIPPRFRYQTASDRIHMLNLALWLTRVTPLAQQLHFHLVQKPGEIAYSEARLADLWEPILATTDHSEGLRPEDLHTAKARFENLYALAPGGAVEVAARQLLKALSDSEAASRYVSLWTAVEALFAPTSVGENTHQLAERLAVFLKGRSANAVETYRQIKVDYDLRSKIVHGLRVKQRHKERFPDSLTRSEDWIRLPLAKLADDPALLATFNDDEERRESYFLNLVLG